MGCGTGCTDCPTCREEVQPESPIMKDMAFAMAMGSGPMSADRFLGPLSIVQTVREGARQRGIDYDGARVMEFLAELATRVIAPVLPFRAGALWDDGPAGGPQGGGSGPIFADWKPEGRGPGGHPNEEAQPESEDLDKWRLPSPSGSGEIIEFDGRCCVEEFRFYARRSNPKFSKTGPTGKKGTTKWKGSSVPAVGLSFVWTATAKFIEDPEAGCFCTCCEYRQYVLFNVLSVTRAGATEVEDPGAAREDCIFVVVEKDAEGKPVIDPDTKKPKTKNERALPGHTPLGTKGQDWWGPFCDGHRGKQGEDDPFSPGDTYPPEGAGCLMKQADEPTVAIPCGSTFTWQIGFMGIIHDACWFYVPRRWRSFSVYMKGSVSGDCNGVVDTGDGVGGWSRPAKRK